MKKSVFLNGGAPGRTAHLVPFDLVTFPGITGRFASRVRRAFLLG